MKKALFSVSKHFLHGRFNFQQMIVVSYMEEMFLLDLRLLFIIHLSISKLAKYIYFLEVKYRVNL